MKFRAVLLLSLLVSESAFSANFSDLKKAEQKDMRALQYSIEDVKSLELYSRTINMEMLNVIEALRPTLVRDDKGWMDCSSSDKALGNAASKAQTIITLEVLADIGLKMENLHCREQLNSLKWKDSFDVSLKKVAAETDPKFVNLKRQLALSTTDSLLQNKSNELFNPEVLACLRVKMQSFKRQGMNEEDARKETLNQCLKK